MKKQKPIIVGIDFSASSPFVLRQATHIGSLDGSCVIAGHVLNSSSLSHWASGEDKSRAYDALVEQAKTRMKQMVKAEAPDSHVVSEVCIGRPAEELSRMVREWDASLLIIAANDMTKKRLGSIASRCVRSVTTDVLIVRNCPSGNYKKMIVCTDLSAASERVIERAIEVAEANNAALELVHVIYPPEQDYWGESIDDGGDDLSSYSERVRKKTKEKMALSLASFAQRLENLEHTSVILESTVPSVDLTYHIKESGADLAVLGTRVHSKLASIFVGTNAERLLHDAPVSVLAVRH